jgi:phage terminase small subunit
MAGVKGRSGGARPGAGRKKKAPTVLIAPAAAAKKAPAGKSKSAAAAPAAPAVLAGIGEAGFDPRPALEQVAMGLLEVSAQQLKALTALLPYVHTKKGEGGKKEQRQEAAEKVAGRFSPAAPPKLAAVGGKKV